MNNIQKGVFISYRSTPYNELREYGCRVVHGMGRCDCKMAMNCDVINCSFRRAAIFANKLEYKCYAVPPTLMLPPESMLRISDFFEKSYDLYNVISKCDIFVRFEIEEDSIWTELELMFWKRHSIRKQWNRCYSISLDEFNEIEVEEIIYNPLDENQARVLDRLVFYTQSEHRYDHAWGAYSNCFICICPSCGEITLFSPSAIRYLISNGIGVNCTFCHQGNFYLDYISERKFQILCDYVGDSSQMKPLSVEMILRLILSSTKDTLSNLHLVCMSHETFTEQVPVVQMAIIIKDYLKKLTAGTDVEYRTYKNDRKKIVKIPLFNFQDVCYSFDVIDSILARARQK